MGQSLAERGFDIHALFLQRLRIGQALVHQGVELGHQKQRRRTATQAGCGVQRRTAPVDPAGLPSGDHG